jgi:hypothetical protein
MKLELAPGVVHGREPAVPTAGSGSPPCSAQSHLSERLARILERTERMRSTYLAEQPHRAAANVLPAGMTSLVQFLPLSRDAA